MEVKVEIAEIKDAEDIAGISHQVADIHDRALPEYFKKVSEEDELNNICEMLGDAGIKVFKAVYDGKICGFLFLKSADFRSVLPSRILRLLYMRANHSNRRSLATKRNSTSHNLHHLNCPFA